jgi:hypothetical protein
MSTEEKSRMITLMDYFLAEVERLKENNEKDIKKTEEALTCQKEALAYLQANLNWLNALEEGGT